MFGTMIVRVKQFRHIEIVLDPTEEFRAAPLLRAVWRLVYSGTLIFLKMRESIETPMIYVLVVPTIEIDRFVGHAVDRSVIAVLATGAPCMVRMRNPGPQKRTPWFNGQTI